MSLCVRLPLAQSQLMRADIRGAETRCITPQRQGFQWRGNVPQQLQLWYNPDIIRTGRLSPSAVTCV